MKIGIVCYPTLGGSGIVATELGHALARANHEVHFITYEPPYRLRTEEHNITFHEVDIYQYDLFRYPDYALTLAVKIAEVTKQHNLDILHVHYAIPHATSAYLAKQLIGREAPKIVTTLHGTDITLVGRDTAYFEIVKFSINQSDVVTAVSEGLKRETYDYFDIDKEIKVIYNFFNPKIELMDRQPLKSKFAPNGERLLIHASNFRGVKRVHDVISIFDTVNQRIPSKLLLVGVGVGIEDVKTDVKNRGLEEQVIFVGKIKEIDPYIASSDLFLLPSSHESFGLVALEALSYGVPVIASNVCGLPEVVRHDETGFLAPVGDVEKMANDAIRLLEDSNLYQNMSQRAKEDAAARFNVEKILSEYMDIYKN